MRTLDRYRIALMFVAVAVVLGWAWSATWAHAPAATVEMGGFGGADAGDESQEPAPRVYFSMPVNPEVAATWEKLKQKVPMHFADQTPLEDVLKSVKLATAGKEGRGIQFYVDPIGLQETDKSMKSPVTIDLEDVPLSTSLELVLKQLDLAFWVQKDGLVVINHKQNADQAVDPTLLILDELHALRQEVRMLRTGRPPVGMGGGMGSPGGKAVMSGGGGMR